MRKKVKNITLKSSTKKSDKNKEEVAESCENENWNLLLKGLKRISKGKVTKVTKRKANLNIMIQITLIVSLVIIVVSKDIYTN